MPAYNVQNCCVNKDLPCREFRMLEAAQGSDNRESHSLCRNDIRQQSCRPFHTLFLSYPLFLPPTQRTQCSRAHLNASQCITSTSGKRTPALASGTALDLWGVGPSLTGVLGWTILCRMVAGTRTSQFLLYHIWVEEATILYNPRTHTGPQKSCILTEAPNGGWHVCKPLKLIQPQAFCQRSLPRQLHQFSSAVPWHLHPLGQAGLSNSNTLEPRVKQETYVFPICRNVPVLQVRLHAL